MVRSDMLTALVVLVLAGSSSVAGASLLPADFSVRVDERFTGSVLTPNASVGGWDSARLQASETPSTLRQRIDWTPQSVVVPEDLPPLSAAATEPTGPALPTLYDGIGPGSALLVGPIVGSISYLCTAAFVVQDESSGDYYLSTAGHCLVRDETDPTPRSGYVDSSRTNNEVRICVRQCLDNALQLGTYVRLYRDMPGAPSGYDPVLFAYSGGIGGDFGLIRIPPSLNDQIRPFMPQFGGPAGTAVWTTAGDLIAHYGHGTYCCPQVGGVASRTPADQGRISVSQGANFQSFTFAGWTSGGDSGSGMSIAEPDADRGFQGTTALGVLTHGLIVGGIGYGTMFHRGLDLAEWYRADHADALPTTSAGLALVNGDDAICLADCGTGPPPVPRVHITSPAHGAMVPPGELLVSGTVNRAPPPAGGAQPQSAEEQLPSSPQATGLLVHPAAGQDLYMQTRVIPVGNADRVTTGAMLVPERPTSQMPSLSVHALTTGTTEAVGEASWTYHGPVSLADAEIAVTWHGRLATSAETETWEAHVFVGAGSIGNFNAPHAFATGTFPPTTAAKTLTINNVAASGDNLVLMLRSPSATVPATVLFGSNAFPSGIRVTEHGAANEPPTAAFHCGGFDLTLYCNATASTDDVGLTSYDWTFGDGDTGSGPSVMHTYAAAGSKRVQLTVTDTDGATNTISHDYEVTERPAPEVIQLRIDGELYAIVEVSSSTPGDHAWNATLDLKGLAAGNHWLNAYWRDTDGNHVANDTVAFSIEQHTMPAIEIISPNHGETVQPGEVAVSGTIDRAVPVDVNGQSSPAGLAVGPQAAGPGNPMDGRDMSNEAPYAAFECSLRGLTVFCDASASWDDEGIVSYDWMFGDGGAGNGVWVNHTYAEPGAKTIRLFVTDADGANGQAWANYNVSTPPPSTERIDFAVDGTFVQSLAVSSTPDGNHAWSTSLDLAGLGAGNHTITASWFDSNGAWLATDLVEIRVPTSNRAPELLVPGNQTVGEGQWLSFNVSAVDPDGDRVSLGAFELPEGAGFDAVTGRFWWQPGYEQKGVYWPVFAAKDGKGGYTQARVQIQVLDTNRDPVIIRPTNQTTIHEGQELLFNISAVDPDGDRIYLRAFDLPEGATFDADRGTFWWHAGYEQAGFYWPAFAAKDGRGGYSETRVEIHVLDTNRAPSLDNIPNATVQVRRSLEFMVHATDPDGQPILYGASNFPEGASFDSSTGEFSWTPSKRQAGEYSIVFSASDGRLVDRQEVHITVTKRA